MSRLAALGAWLAAAACGSSNPSGPATGAGGQSSGGSPGSPSGPAPVGGAGGAGGSGGLGGAGAGGAGGSSGPDAAAPGSNDASAAPAPTPPLTPAVCSDPGPDPTPIMGFTKADPIDTRFPFSTHFMGRFSDNPRCVSMTSLTDLDNDGDQDFASGQRDVACSGQANPNAPMVWWEYCSADHWVRHLVSTGFKSAAAGGAADFDGDGWIDLTAGDSWFKNPGPSVRTAASWMRFPTGAPGVVEETTVGDVTGDGKLDVLHVERSIRPQWWSPGPDATRPWVLGAQLPYNQQQGGAIGDIDGDGRNDIVVGDRWWYRSTGMAGAGMASWPPMPITETNSFAPGSPVNGSAPIVMLGDMDGDADLDLVLQQHWGSRVAWLENGDGKGVTWVEHMIAGPGGPIAAKNRNILHGLLVNDFDNDGDIDVLAGENQGTLWIFENTDGKGTFVEHIVASGPSHEARAADVDCDGDIDIAGKPWGDPNDGPAGASETLRLHVYFKNELVERGGPPLFERPRGEVWNVPNRGLCKR